MKIGIALAGGGIRGAAHVGVIKALEENNIEIDYIGGTSSGSIVSALYAMGYNSDEMLNLFNYFAKEVVSSDHNFLVNSMKENFRINGIRSRRKYRNCDKGSRKIQKYK